MDRRDIVVLVTGVGVWLSACGDGSGGQPNAPSSDPAADAGSSSSSGELADGFTIGGTVSGLANGAHAALRLNDGPPLSVVVGSFEFPDRVAVGAAYRVTVAPPDGYQCVVAADRGTMPAVDVRDVRVDCTSSDATLAMLVPSIGILDPPFNPAVASYTLLRPPKGTTVLSGPEPLTLVGSPSDPASTLLVEGVVTQSGTPSAALTFDATVPRVLDVTVRSVAGSELHYAITVAAPASIYVKASNAHAQAAFGGSFALDGDTLVVGASGEGSSATGVNGNQDDNSAAGAGAVYVFVRDGASWRQQAYLKASNARAGASFGASVAIAGDTIVVGSPNETSQGFGVDADQTDTTWPSSGAAYIFHRADGVWTQTTYLGGGWKYGGYGAAVAIENDLVAIGAPLDGFGGYFGTVFLYRRAPAGTWALEKYLHPATGKAFGQSVALSNGTLLVGDPGDTSHATGVGGDPTSTDSAGSGAAYVFTESGGTWPQQAYLKASNVREGMSFGLAVALHGDTAVVATPLELGTSSGIDGDQQAVGSSQYQVGAAFIFGRAGSAWSQQAYVKAPVVPSFANLHFGQSVAVRGSRVLVGATAESNAAVGIDGDLDAGTAAGSGAAFSYLRTGTTWALEHYLKPSNTRPGLSYGSAVTFDDTTFVVGAGGDNSIGGGVNADQLGNPAGTGTGAVFTY